MATTNIELDIQNITGVADADEQFIVSAQKMVVSSIPKELMTWASSESAAISSNADTDAVLNVDSLLSVKRNGYGCREISSDDLVWASDSSSLRKATTKHPVYAISGGNIQIQPEPSVGEEGYYYYVDFSKVDDNSDLRNAVIYHASSKEFTKLAVGKIPSWSSITAPSTIPSPSFGGDLTISSNAPSTPSITTVTYVDAIGSDASAPTFTTATISAGDTFGANTPPEYDKPEVTLSTLSSISDLVVGPSIPNAPSLDVSNVTITGTAPVYNSPIIALSDAPSISSLSFSITSPSAPNLSANTAVVGTAPTYTKPTLTGTPSFPTLSWNIPSRPIAPQIQANTSSTGGSEVDLTKLANAPTYTPPVMQAPDWADINNWINSEEDPEMSAARVQSIQAQISDYQARLNESQQVFNKENIEYQAKLQIALQDANQGSQGDNSLISQFGSEVQAYQTEVNSIIQNNVQQVQSWQTEYAIALQEFGTDIQNELNEFNSQNVQFQAELQLSIQNAQLLESNDAQALQKYQAEVQDYQSEVNTEIQTFQSNLQKDLELWRTKRQTELQKYSADIQNNLNAFNESNVEYQAKLQKDVTDAQLADANEQRKLAKYQAEIQAYQQEVNKTLQEFNGNVQKNISVFNAENQSKLNQYQADIQNELNEFNKENVAYQANIQDAFQQVQIANQNNIAEAQAQLQVAIDNKNREQQRALQNAIQEMQAVVQDNNAILSKFQAESQTYGVNINKEVQAFANTLTKNVQEYQSKLALYNADVQKYNAELGQEAQKNALSVQNASFYSQESRKYYDWAILEITTYIRNNSKIIASTIAQQQQGGQ